MSDGGKGSKPRPLSVANEEYAARWDAIFGRDRLEDSETDKTTRNNNETQEALAQGKSVPLSSLPELQEIVCKGLADGTLFLS